MTRTEAIESVRNNTETCSLSYDAAQALSCLGALAGFEDITYEIGLYDRAAYRATLEQWENARTLAAEARDSLKGSERGTLTAAINRMPSMLREADYMVARAERREARRAARRAARND